MKKLIPLVVFGCAFTASAATVTSVKFKALDGFGGAVGAAASRCQTKVGSEYSSTTITRDVTQLKSSNEFETISVDANETEQGVEVTFFVKRKVRFLAPLTVTGCDAFSESRVQKESELKDGFLYGEADLAAAAQKVRHAYQKKGYEEAKVVPRTEIISGNDAKITFLVDEGREIDIDEVVFEGADHAIETGLVNRNMNPFHALEEGEFEAVELHDAASDFPWWDPSGWFNDDPVTRDQRAQCCDKIAEVYRNYGYLDVQVSGPEVRSAEDGSSRLVFKIEEGVRYLVGASKIRGLKRYSAEDVANKAKLPEPGVVASQKLLDDAAQRIRVVVGSGDLGLADTRVDIKRLPTLKDPSVVDLVFQVTEGVPVVIHDVKIRGNDYTQDKVIRREIALGPGDRMLEDRAERSQKRLENLDYFSRVRYYLEETATKTKDANGAEERDLVYEVAEKNTGAFMVGVGASSVDSVYLTAEVNQNNFDLFAPSKLFRGGGQKGRAYAAWGPRYQSAEIGFEEPYFLARMLQLSVDAYRRLRWYDQYDLVRSGGQVALTYPVKFWPTWNAFGRLGLGFSGEYIEMQDVQDGYFYTEDNEFVSFEDEKHDYSKAFEPAFRLFWTRDTRDNFRMPTSGHRIRLFGDLVPGNKSSYWRLGFNYRQYYNLWKKYNHVVMFNLRTETIDAYKNEVPIYNRMFLGGPKSIRGIEYRNVAPMATNGRNRWDPWGGQTLACVNLEYTIPIIKMFRVALFTDFGSVGADEFDLDFSDTFAWTAGLGLRLDIPMFPIRFDFGFPIEKPDHAEDEVFSFTVGYDF